MTGPAGQIAQGGRARGNQRRRVVHGDVSQIAGASKISAVLWVVMLAAVGVDLVTFYQVLVLVLDVEEWMVRVAVVGFALVALTLSYYAGLQARQAANPRNIIGSVTAGWIAAGVWLALGVAAFVARYVISLPSSAGKSTFVADGVTTSTLADSADATSQRLGALLFLVLYVATGVVAALHGFFRPEPAVKQYRRALDRRSEVARLRARSDARLEFARQTLESIEQARQRHAETLRQAENQSRMIAEQLRNEAVAELSGFHRRMPRSESPGVLYGTPRYAAPGGARGAAVGRADVPEPNAADDPTFDNNLLGLEPTQEIPRFTTEGPHR
ncbi:hypothetical protein [Allorhizocola rhizosphaerae]|uniref:hypothetical protein n=1 Tax=Allorhizocola rhizosphaerae TaxID=1872709 RepID=UPI000E3D23D5|nr:hypothetical protein [Allorhizocola rhizosphaerae]